MAGVARAPLRYPLGIDVVLADAHRLAALPRTTRVVGTPNPVKEA